MNIHEIYSDTVETEDDMCCLIYMWRSCWDKRHACSMIGPSLHALLRWYLVWAETSGPWFRTAMTSKLCGGLLMLLLCHPSCSLFLKHANLSWASNFLNVCSFRICLYIYILYSKVCLQLTQNMLCSLFAHNLFTWNYIIVNAHSQLHCLVTLLEAESAVVSVTNFFC